MHDSKKKDELKRITRAYERTRPGRSGASKVEKEYTRKINLVASKVVKWSQKYSERNMADGTVKQVQKAIGLFIRYLDHYNVTLNGINRERYKAFCDMYAESDYSAASKKVLMVYIRLFLKYLFENEELKRFSLDSESMKMSARRKIPNVKMVPCYEDIIKLRSLNTPIERALYIEMIMSTGLRISEMLQVRYCDLTDKDVPFDNSTGSRCKYSGGSISLNRTVHSIKNNRSRKVYYSKFAGRLLRIYMKINSIKKMNLRIPVFPWTKSGIDNWIEDINKAMVFRSVNSVKNIDEGDESIDISEQDLLELPNSMQALIRRRMKDPLKVSRRIGKIDTVETDSGSMNLTSHSIRHLFAAIQVFRDYRGGSNDLEYVKLLLGHTSTGMATTLKYISRVDLISNKSQWERLMIGGPGDWNNIIVKPVNINLMGIKKRRASET